MTTIGTREALDPGIAASGEVPRRNSGLLSVLQLCRGECALLWALVHPTSAADNVVLSPVLSTIDVRDDCRAVVYAKGILALVRVGRRPKHAVWSTLRRKNQDYGDVGAWPRGSVGRGGSSTLSDPQPRTPEHPKL